MQSFVLLLAILCSLGVAPHRASAEIALAGQAQMGLLREGGKTQAEADLYLTLKAARVTDAGVEFGAVVDVTPPARRAFRPTAPRAYVYFATGDFVAQPKP